MKVLVTIESIEVIRKVQRNDGTWGNVYGVTMASGDDKILAECWKTEEGQKKSGIVKGAIGTAKLDFHVNRGTSRAGNPYLIQNIKLDRFDLANRNISTEQPATAEPSSEELAAGMAELAEAHEAHINPETGMPF